MEKPETISNHGFVFIDGKGDADMLAKYRTVVKRNGVTITGLTVNSDGTFSLPGSVAVEPKALPIPQGSKLLRQLVGRI